jgi:hypothetical protein
MNTLRIVGIGIIFSFLVYLSGSSNVAALEPTKALRMENAKESLCQTKQNVIKGRMNNLVRTSTNMMTVFTNISERTMQFYANKVVPKGVTVPNYDELSEVIEAKKEAVEGSLDTAENHAKEFSCESGTPRTAVATFRTDMQDVKAKLKELRTAVRALIVAVHNVNKSVSVTPTTGL